MNQRKLNIGFISSFPLAKTGFSRNAKALLPILYKTGKYNIFYLNQCMPPDAPEFQKLPWKSEGVFKNLDQNRFNSDTNYQRFCGYGNTMAEEFVVKNKLDVVFHIEDIWSANPDIYLKSDWFNYIKKNFVQWSTADSLPLLNDFKDWAKACPNLWFWSSFAERAIKQENKDLYGHCKTVHGAIDTEDFKPLSKEEKLSLRKKFNIKEEDKIVIYLGRNQLRKQYWALLEGMAKYKQKYPDKNFKLLFHCHWGEPGGWPLDKIRQELGLKKEDVLTTYYCRNCNDWNIQPYEGEELNCNHCKAEKSRITAGVGSSINEKDLNKIYNLADGSASVPTSAGLEYCHVESLLAGIPLGTVPYAGAEEFTPNDFVFTINGTFTRECGSAFKKFVPSIDCIVEFYHYIDNLSIAKNKEISEKGREWAIKEFDSKKIAAYLECFIDSCKPIDWDSFIAKKKELKNINAQIHDKQTDDEFVMECYSKILNMEPSPTDEGRIHWNKFLSQNVDKMKLKNEMVNSMRSAGQIHNNKVQPGISFESLLDKNDKSRILLALKESLGDCYLLSSLLPEIKNKYPETSIYIGCDPKYFEVFENNEYLKKCLPWMPEMDNEMQMVGFGGHKGYFNNYVNIGIGTQKILNYLSNKY